MSPNGTAALKLVSPEPQTASVPTSASALPGPAPDIVAEIGEAMVSAACAVSAAMEQYRDGGISPAVREAGGERLARLTTLAMATEGQLDFGEVARREGKRRLRQYLDAEPGFRRRHGPEGGEAMLDVFITGALEIVADVVRFEKVVAIARAN